jgi:putative ABC transport system substrate-binding protein
VRRRQFIMLLGAAAAWPLGARAQQPGKLPRIGYLSPSSAASGFLGRDNAFREGLSELGYVERKNIIIEYRFADGQFDRLAPLAAELVALNVDIIVAVVTQASVVAKTATTTIPIVMVAVSDPQGAGLVPSLARPEGNVTGTASQTTEMVGKSLQLLKEVVPKAARVAVLWNPHNAVFQAQMLKETTRTAAVLGLQLTDFGTRNPAELDRSFAVITEQGADALMVLADPFLLLHRGAIVGFAERRRLPAVYGIKDYAAAGGLMTYAADMLEQFRRAAAYVDKILKGAKPADLPVEQPTKFELVINLKTARALALEIPLPLLGRADEVIE